MGNSLELELQLRKLSAVDSWTDEQRTVVDGMLARIQTAFDDVLAVAGLAENEWERTLEWLVGDEDGSEQ